MVLTCVDIVQEHRSRRTSSENVGRQEREMISKFKCLLYFSVISTLIVVSLIVTMPYMTSVILNINQFNWKNATNALHLQAERFLSRVGAMNPGQTMLSSERNTTEGNYQGSDKEARKATGKKYPDVTSSFAPGRLGKTECIILALIICVLSNVC